MSLDDNPTGVNSFNGTSDETKAAEVAQGLWDRIVGGDDNSPQPPPAPAPAADSSAAASSPPEKEQAPEASSSEDEVEFSDLDDYLAKAKLERDSFLSLPVKLKIDGKDEQATLSDLIRAAQLDRHVNLKSQKLSDQQKTWEAERAQAQAAIQQQWQQA